MSGIVLGSWYMRIKHNKAHSLNTWTQDHKEGGFQEMHDILQFVFLSFNSREESHLVHILGQRVQTPAYGPCLWFSHSVDGREKGRKGGKKMPWRLNVACRV